VKQTLGGHKVRAALNGQSLIFLQEGEPAF
jgi:hypothetical protein